MVIIKHDLQMFTFYFLQKPFEFHYHAYGHWSFTHSLNVVWEKDDILLLTTFYDVVNSLKPSDAYMRR